MIQEKFAIAFVHFPDGEVGRSEFVFTTHDGAQLVCDELNGECPTIHHFVLGDKENLRVLAKEKIKEHRHA